MLLGIPVSHGPKRRGGLTHHLSLVLKGVNGGPLTFSEDVRLRVGAGQAGDEISIFSSGDEGEGSSVCAPLGGDMHQEAHLEAGESPSSLRGRVLISG